MVEISHASAEDKMTCSESVFALSNDNLMWLLLLVLWLFVGFFPGFHLVPQFIVQLVALLFGRMLDQRPRARPAWCLTGNFHHQRATASKNNRKFRLRACVQVLRA